MMMVKLKTWLDAGYEWDALIENRMDKTSCYKLTIIVPVYNEEENIYRLRQRLSAFISHSIDFPVCVLFVNDGSTDSSGDMINDMCYSHEHFYYINLAMNSGLSATLKAGIDVVRSIYVGYIDADLQTTSEDFNLLIPYLEEYEMVMGIRGKREDSIFKRISAKIANRFRRFMTKDGIEDTGCPLKVMQTIYAKRIPLFSGIHCFLPALVQLQNGKVKQIPVRHFPRIAGKSKYHLTDRLFAPFIDCFAYCWIKNRYINYLIADNNIDQ